MVDINKKEKEKERSVLVEMAAKAQLSSRTNQRLFIHSLFSLLSLSLSLSLDATPRKYNFPRSPERGTATSVQNIQKKIRKTTTKKEERERKEYKKRGEGSGGGRGGGGGGGGRM